jgi:hypothetical protein
MNRLCRLLALVVLLGILADPGDARAGMPPYLNVQGVLRNVSGELVTGQYTLLFRIYSAETGGTKLWEESRTLTIANGVFSVYLGPFPSNPFAENDEGWLELKVATDPPLARMRLSAVGFAFLADRARHCDELVGPAKNLVCASGACVSASEVDFPWARGKTAGGAAADLDCMDCVSSAEIADGTVTSADIGIQQVESVNLAPDLDLTGNTQAANLLVKGGLYTGTKIESGTLRLTNTGDLVHIGSIDLHGVLTSTVPKGTAPFSVQSDQTVSNLSADYLDGLDSSFFLDAGNLASGTLAPSLLPKATTSTLGAVIVGSGLGVDPDGTIYNDGVTNVSATLPLKDVGTLQNPILTLGAASGTVDGYLSSGDWTTFSKKLAAVETCYTGSTNPACGSGAGKVPFAPFAGSGTTTSPLGMQQAGATTGGWLSASDWQAFNTKAGDSGSPNYIQNQTGAVQAASFRIGGTAEAGASLTVPVVFDRNDTAYFLDPAGSVGGVSAILGGKVGVGTKTPGASLDVAGGNVRTDGQFVSTASTGAPLIVASSVVVAGFNSDLLDGKHASDFATADGASPKYVQNQKAGAQAGDFWLAGTGTVAGDFSAGRLCLGGTCKTGWAEVTGPWTVSGNDISNSNTGYVGIGTSTPSELLDVAGKTRIAAADGAILLHGTRNGRRGVEWFYGASGDRYGMAQAPGGNLALYASSTNAASFLSFNLANDASADFSELGRFTHGGRLGVGTKAPSTRLQLGDVYSGVASGWPADSTQGIMIGQDTDDVFLGLIDDGADADRAALMFGDNDDDFLRILWHNASGVRTELIRILYDGRMGIGVTNPGAKLDVDGSVKGTQFCIGADCVTNWSTAGTNYWSVSGTSLYPTSTTLNVGLGMTSAPYRLTLAGGPKVFGVDNTASFVAKNAAGNYEEYLWPRFSDDVMYVNYGANGFNVRNNASTSAMFFTNAGNVGIGTTAPGQRLHVRGGSAKLDGGDLLLADTADATAFRIKSYNNAANLWFLSGTGGASHLVLATDHDWDLSASLRYTPGTAGAGTGVLELGQILKNAGTYTHGTTVFYTNGAERMRLTSAGRVGVGTPGPEGILHVVGGSTGVATIIGGDGPAGAGTYNVSGANFLAGLETRAKTASPPPGVVFHHQSVFTMYLQGQNSPRGLRVTGPSNEATASLFVDGSLGVGTTSPAYHVHVLGGKQRIESTDYADGQMQLYNPQASSAAGSETSIGFFNTDQRWVVGPGACTGATGDSPFGICNPNGPVMSLTKGGAVGIGTTTPGYKLDVSGDANATRLCIAGTCKSAWPGGAFSGSDNYLSKFSGGGTTIVNSQVFDDGTNLGIGTTGPNQKLHVVGNVRIAGQPTSSRLYFGDDDTTKSIGIEAWWMTFRGHGNEGWKFIDNSGDVLFQVNGLGGNTGFVGIGTASPGYHLHLLGGKQRIESTDYSDGQFQIFNPQASSAAGSEISIGFLNTNQRWAVGPGACTGATGDSPFGICAPAGPVMSLTKDGSVGIGTTAPTAKLHVVAGSIKITDNGANTGLSIAGSWIGDHYDGILHLRSGGSTVMFDGDDNVGIGTVSPQTRFQVNMAGTATNGPFFLSPELASNDDATATWIGKSKGGAGESFGIGYRHRTTAAERYGFLIVEGDQPGTGLVVKKGGLVGIGTTAPAYGLDVNGTMRLGGFTGNDADEWPNVVWYRDTANNWDEGLIKGSSSRGVWGRAGYGIHFNSTRHFMFASTGWDPLVDIEGGTGRLYVKGATGIGTNAPDEKLSVYGNVRVGSKTAATGTGNWGNALILSGGPALLSGYGSDNSDPMWLARYNPAANQSELRIVIGDDPGQAEDRLVVGPCSGIGEFSQSCTFVPKFIVTANGDVTATSFNGTLTGSVNASKVASGNFGADTGSGNYGFPGSVIIGQTLGTAGAPAAKLDVRGDLRVINGPNAYWDAVHIWSEGEHGRIYSEGDEKGLWIKSQYERVHVDSPLHVAGNLGVGISAPEAALHVSGMVWLNRPSVMVDGGHTIGGRILFTPPDFAAGDTNGYFGLYWPDGNTVRLGTDYDGHLGGGHLRDIQFGRYTDPYVTIKDGGNVGIGTTTPSAAKLVVNGGIDLSGPAGETFLSRWPTVSPWGPLTIRFGNGNGANSQGIRFQTTNAAMQYTDRLVLHTDADATFLLLNPSGGNVGIGTTGPTTALTVKKLHPAAYGGGTRMLDFMAAFPGYDEAAIKASISSGTSDKYTLNTNGGFLAFLVNQSGYSGSGPTNLIEAMRIEKNGNVGVKTVSPAYDLDVAGKVNASSQLCIAGDCRGSWPAGTIGGSGTANYLAKWTAGSTLGNGTIYDNGNVGIGTASPDHKLHVAGDFRLDTPYKLRFGSVAENSDDIYFRRENPAGNQSDLRLYIHDDAGDDDRFSIWANSCGGGACNVDANAIVEHYFTNSGTAWHRNNLYVGGNVGIGTTSPATKLDVAGPVALNDNPLRFRSGGDNCHRAVGDWSFPSSPTGFGLTLASCNSPVRILGADTLGLFVTTTGYVGIRTTAPGNPLTVIGRGDFAQVPNASSDTGGDVNAYGLSVTNSVDSTLTIRPLGGGVMHVATDASGRQIRFGGGLFEQTMTVAAGGNVGVGTTAPLDKFMVKDGRIVQWQSFSGPWGGTYPEIGAKFVSLGNVDVGAQPTSGSIYGMKANWDSDSVVFGIKDYGQNRKDGVIAWGDDGNDNLRFLRPNDVEAAIITGAGDVGIGTTSPGAKLEVAGNIVATGIRYKNPSACVVSSRSWTGNEIIAAHNTECAAGRNLSTSGVCPSGYAICPTHVAKVACDGNDIKSDRPEHNPYGRHMWTAGWTLSDCCCIKWDQARTRSLFTQHYGVTPIADAPGSVGCPAGSHMAVQPASPTADWNYYICAPDSETMYVLCCNYDALDRIW